MASTYGQNTYGSGTYGNSSPPQQVAPAEPGSHATATLTTLAPVLKDWYFDQPAKSKH